MVHDGDELVGFVWTECDARPGESWVDVYVGPERTDVADAFVAFGTALAREHSAAHRRSSSGACARAASPTDAETSPAPWSAAGSSRSAGSGGCAWTSRAMTPVAPVLLPASDPRRVRPANRRTTYGVRSAAFDDHWNHTTRPFDEWFGFFDQLPTSTRPAGGCSPSTASRRVCILDDSRRGSPGLRALPRRPARPPRPGASRRLSCCRGRSRWYAERGLRSVQLGVDSTGEPTGANHPTSVGMRPTRVIDAWALWLTAEVPAGDLAED